MASKGKDPFIEALKKIEAFAPTCSSEAVALTEATEEAGLEVHNWRDAVLHLQRIARKALREAGREI